MDNQVMLSRYQQVFDPIKDHQRTTLREKAEQLKQSDGEDWAIGEMLERACILLDALEIANHAQTRHSS